MTDLLGHNPIIVKGDLYSFGERKLEGIVSPDLPFLFFSVKTVVNQSADFQ